MDFAGPAKIPEGNKINRKEWGLGLTGEFQRGTGYVPGLYTVHIHLLIFMAIQPISPPVYNLICINPAFDRWDLLVPDRRGTTGQYRAI